MTTISHVRQCNPKSMVNFAADLAAQNDTFTSRVEQMDHDVASAMNSWQGEAATAASARGLSQKLAGNHLGETVVALADHFNGYGSELDGYRTTLLNIVDHELPHAGMVVDDGGNVTAPMMPSKTGASTAPLAVVLIQQALNAQASGFQTRIKTLLVQFGDAEAKAAQAITSELQHLGEYEKTPDGPPVRSQVQDVLDGRAQLPTDPKQLRDFWETLTPAEKDALWRHDQYLGNRDGLPVVDRDHYNRMKLQDELARAQAGDPAVKNRLDDLHTVVSSISGPDRYLMLLDTQTGHNAHAAVSIGNPDTADHVATYVPGTGAQPSKMSDDMLRSQKMFDRGRASGAEHPAVIAWIGYDTPPTPVDVGQHLDPFNWDVNDASNRRYADAGVSALDRFQDGLRASHDGTPSYNSVVAHSYGTTLVGDAAAHGRSINADAVALVASPGTTVNHASDLHLTGVPQDQVPNHVFATKAQHDMIQMALLADPFGASPTNPEFGAQVFASDPGQDGHTGYTTAAHSQYWDFVNGKPCKSLVNLGDIIAGHTPTVK
ncbi:hypothetical protein IU500_28220 [Nocardia terpenica]|uniref:alpha/beta hydrolase n=1 Tax=Nocardia terpenica TaxID=455432 RepID=UPI001893424B|nr:alpha/beta hydrolase [Nocardia terpenica]MBF6065173.1 hypothetical protein [Nocardia terpenica]MBF6107900.1 hypothetical protein [Nocardia terpenica]MBF6115569.1 hypothetical protein [Nocardia terpenica]MBF6122006.1 hypothetical protein [Nocardia terpenica]MBF6155450.1 hypothetical protein [Nocardia terpenica]